MIESSTKKTTVKGLSHILGRPRRARLWEDHDSSGHRGIVRGDLKTFMPTAA